MTIRARKYLLQKKISSVPPIFSQKFVPTLSMGHAGNNLILQILKSSQRYESEKLRSIINCIVRSTTFANWLNWKFISKYMPFLTSLATSLWWKLSMTSSITWFTIQVALFVGGKNGSLVKHYLKIPDISIVYGLCWEIESHHWFGCVSLHL